MIQNFVLLFILRINFDNCSQLQTFFFFIMFYFIIILFYYPSVPGVGPEDTGVEKYVQRRDNNRKVSENKDSGVI